MTISIRKIYINQLCQDNCLRVGTGINELILQLQLRRGRSTFMPVLFMFVTWRHKSLMLWGAPPRRPNINNDINTCPRRGISQPRGTNRNED